MKKIIFTGDFLYNSEKQNKEQLCLYFKIFEPIIRSVVDDSIELTFDIVNVNNEKFSREKFFALNAVYNLKNIYNQYNVNKFNSEQLNYLKDFFNKDTIVIAFELYQPLCNLLTSFGCKVLDFAFHSKFAQSHLSEFLLDFTNIYSKKIAFSASFGVSKEQFIAETDTKTIERMKNLLKGFDYISIREKAGVKICKELFDIDAEWIIDPVFMIDKSNYENISKNSNLDSTGKIVSYIFGKNKTNTKLFNHLKNNIYIWNSNSDMEGWISD